MKRLIFSFLVACLLLPRQASGAERFVFFDGTAATVNREVLFISDLLFEQCLLLCGALPDSPPRELSLHEIRDRIIPDMLVLQEREKLSLGQVDNVLLAQYVQEARTNLALCESPCRHDVSPERLAAWIERKLVIRDFLRSRVGIFVDISEEDVRKELERMTKRGESVTDLSYAYEEIRSKIREERFAREVKNWFARTSSKAAITLSPLEGR